MPSVILAGTTTGTALSLTSDTSGELQIQTNNGATTAMTLTTAGNVGLGTTSPSVAAGLGLVLNGAGSQTRLAFKNTYTGDASGDGVQFALVNGTSAFIFQNRESDGTFAWETNSVERMRIDSSGNVGIGTSSPGAKLDISGNYAKMFTSATNLNWELTDGTVKAIYGVDSTSSVAAFFGSQTNHPTVFRTNNTERMRITSAGDVGIGTSSNSYTAANRGNLNIAGSSGAILGFQMSGSPKGYVFHNGTDFQMWNEVAGTVLFATNALERMRIDSSGNLLVGTTTSDGILTVKTPSNTGSGGVAVKNGSGDSLFLVYQNGYFTTGLAGASPYNLTTSNSANVFINSDGALLRSTSSLKYKTDVQDATHGLAEMLKLRSVTYKGSNDGDTIFGGLIAEEVHDAGLTEFVQYAEDGSPDALAYGQMVSLCIKAIQEQQALIENLTNRLNALEGK
jgi:hypothetical protein